MEFKSYAVLDMKSRIDKAKKIEAVVEDFKRIKECKILDIGCGSGIIASYLGKKAKKVWALDLVDERVEKRYFNFKKVKNEALPFKNEFFNAVISNQVIEHVNNKEKHLSEIKRVLKNDGICYLATANKFVIKEPHYNLLFLSWLPKNLADFYIKLKRKGDNYDIRLLSFNSCTKSFKNAGFKVINYTPLVLMHPKKYCLESSAMVKLAGKLPQFILTKLNSFMPSYIFVLKK